MARRWAGLRQALERRNYRLFVAGQLVLRVGTWTQSVAQSWLVYRLTGSAFWLGVASFCQQAPAFLLASIGGLVADRHRRRTINRSATCTDPFEASGRHARRCVLTGEQLKDSRLSRTPTGD